MNLWLILAIAELGLIAVVGQIAALFFWHVLREQPSSQTEPPFLATRQTPNSVATRSEDEWSELDREPRPARGHISRGRPGLAAVG
jgi:hypothetical protein